MRNAAALLGSVGKSIWKSFVVQPPSAEVCSFGPSDHAKETSQSHGKRIIRVRDKIVGSERQRSGKRERREE